jgi:hypothetical protein
MRMGYQPVLPFQHPVLHALRGEILAEFIHHSFVMGSVADVHPGNGMAWVQVYQAPNRSTLFRTSQSGTKANPAANVEPRISPAR